VTRQPSTFGEYIHTARVQRGYSLRDMEKRTGLNNSTIKRIEDGAFAVPSPDAVMALVDALKLDIIAAVELIEPYQRLYHRIATAQKGRRPS
jgi:transcriptional regulator with XRE-family HTH domain